MKVVFKMYDGSKYAYKLPVWFEELPFETWKQAAHDLFPHVEGIISGFKEIPAPVVRKSIKKKIAREMWYYFPYLIATVAGFFLRGVLMCFNGYEYAVEWRDVLNAAICFMIVYFTKKLIYTIKSKKAP